MSPLRSKPGGAMWWREYIIETSMYNWLTRSKQCFEAGAKSLFGRSFFATWRGHHLTRSHLFFDAVTQKKKKLIYTQKKKTKLVSHFGVNYKENQLFPYSKKSILDLQISRFEIQISVSLHPWDPLGSRCRRCAICPRHQMVKWPRQMGCSGWCVEWIPPNGACRYPLGWNNCTPPFPLFLTI